MKLGNLLASWLRAEWFVGSDTVGSGVAVQTNTWRQYIDHARHILVVSPVTSTGD
jgi:hypothetical protein